MRVRYLGWEDPLEEDTATHSRILAWGIPLDRGGWWAIVHSVIQSWTGLKRLSTQTHSIKYSYYSDCLLRNLYAGQAATVRTRHGTTDCFQTGKGVRQGCIFSPCLFNFYAEYIMRNARLDEHKLESRLQGEISITSDMQMTPPFWQKAKRNYRAS